jgi:hypothetical protein
MAKWRLIREKAGWAVLARCWPRPGEEMTHFLTGLPLWGLALLLVVLPTALSMCVVILIRRRVGLERLASNNEIAGFKFATVGVIYAVLLAFAVIVVWEKFSGAETAVVQEAGAAATIYRLVDGSDPESVATGAAMGNYLRLAIERDWPAMDARKRSPDVTQALNELYGIAVRMTEKQTKDRAIYYEIFKQLDVITQARRTRLHLATGVVPPMIWIVLYVGATLTVGFTFFVRHKEPTGAGYDDRRPVLCRISWPSRYRLDQLSLYWSRAGRIRAACCSDR